MKRISKFVILCIFLLVVTALTVSADPVMNTITDKTANEGSSVSWTVTCSAPDNGSTKFDINGASFLSITKVSNTQATISGTVPTTAVGPYTVTVYSEDDNSTDYTSFTLTVVEVLPGFTVTEDVIIGGTSQKRSNPDADDEEYQDVYASKQFTITNTGDETLTGIDFSMALSGWTESEVNLSFSPSSITSLVAGANVAITVTGRIPEDLDAVDSTTYEEEAQTIGTLTVTSGSLSDSATIKMQAENQLELDDVDVCVEDNCEAGKDGKQIDDIKPGDDVEVEIIVENKFKDSDNEDLDIEDVNVEVEIDDADFDVSEDEDIGDLGATEDSTVTISFDVDNDADGTSSMDIITYGRDEHGALHGDKMVVDLKVEKEKHDIRVDTIQLDPAVSCSKIHTSQTIIAQVNIENIGKDDEDEVKVRLEVPELGIIKVITDIELREGRDSTETLTFIIPANTEAGLYGVEVKVYYDHDDLLDTKTVVLTVPECGVVPDDSGFETQDVEDEVEDEIVLQSDTSSAQTQTVPTTIKKGTKTSSGIFGEGYTALLIGGIVVAIILAIVLITAILKKGSKKKEEY